MQQFADDADGENILVVSHWDAVSGSVARLRPWTISDHVAHTAFTVAYREKKPGAPPLATLSCVRPAAVRVVHGAAMALIR